MICIEISESTVTAKNNRNFDGGLCGDAATWVYTVSKIALEEDSGCKSGSCLVWAHCIWTTVEKKWDLFVEHVVFVLRVG